MYLLKNTSLTKFACPTCLTKLTSEIISSSSEAHKIMISVLLLTLNRKWSSGFISPSAKAGKIWLKSLRCWDKYFHGISTRLRMCKWTITLQVSMLCQYYLVLKWCYSSKHKSGNTGALQFSLLYFKLLNYCWNCFFPEPAKVLPDNFWAQSESQLEPDTLIQASFFGV